MNQSPRTPVPSPSARRALVLAGGLLLLLPSCFRKSNDGSGGSGGPPAVTPVTPFPVGPALFADLDRNGVANAGDEVWVTFDRSLELLSPDASSFPLLVQGDRYGVGATVEPGPTPEVVRIVLGTKPILKSRQVQDGSDLLRNAPSALNFAGDGSLLDLATGTPAEPAALPLDLLPAFVPAPSTAGGAASPTAFAFQPDLDLDGLPDLVRVSPATQEVEWFLGLGDGTHVSMGVADLGFPPDVCAMADLDRDRQADLVVGSPGPARISVFRFVSSGPGDVGFSPWTTSIDNGAAEVRALELLDLDRDGYRDIVVGTDVACGWLRNLSGVSLDGPFALSASATHAIASGDLDANGIPDLVLGHSGPNSVLLGGCTGVFVERPPLGTLDTRALAIGDVDGDGSLDVIESGSDGDAWYQGTDTGVFFEQPLEAAGGPARALALEDVDQDGRPELVRLVDLPAGRALTLSLPAAGGFVFPGLGIAADLAEGPLSLADADGDGDRDLYLPGAEGRLWESSLSGTWGAYLLTSLDPGGFGLGSSGACVLVDLDGDGDLDIVHAKDALVVVRRNLGDGTFQELVELDTGQNRIEDLATADLDQDGDVDLLVAGIGQGLQVFLQDDLTFTPTVAGLVPNVGPLNSVAVGDLNQDGSPDVVVGALRNTTDKVLMNQGPSGVPGLPGGDTVPPCTWIGLSLAQELSPKMTHDVQLADVDLDGDLDAVFGHGIAEADAVWLNFQGQGFLIEALNALSTDATHAVRVAELDGDGLPDLLVVGAGQQNRIWLGQGGGQFAAGPLVPDSDCRTVEIVDLDGDGQLDLLTGKLFQGGLDVRLGPPTDWTPGPDQSFDATSVRDLAVGDVDGDGDLEILTANSAAGGPNLLLGSR